MFIQANNLYFFDGQIVDGVEVEITGCPGGQVMTFRNNAFDDSHIVMRMEVSKLDDKKTLIDYSVKDHPDYHMIYGDLCIVDRDKVGGIVIAIVNDVFSV